MAIYKQLENKPLENERALLIRVSTGDQKAFAVIFEHFSRYIYSFALKLTRSDALAEEIVQEVFLKIWVNRGRLNTVENFGGYLNRVTRNHAFNVLKRVSHEALINAEIGKQLSEEVNDTEDQINFKDAGRSLNTAIERLTPQQKTVYNLCHKEGLKYGEVADRLNISQATVHSHMKQALHTIRTYFMRLTPLLIWFFFAG